MRRLLHTVGVLAVLAADHVFARAGGGGHSGSSSSHHSSSNGFGDGGSFGGLIALLLVGLLIWYVTRRLRAGGASSQAIEPGPRMTPAAMTSSMGGAGAIGGAGALGGNPLGASALGATLGAALGAVSMARNGMAGVAYGRPGLPPAVDAICASDPQFELETFLQRAEMSFFLVKRGMQKNDAGAVRPYLGDAVFAQVSAYLTSMKSRHAHALFESLNVRAVHLEDAACDSQGQRLVVHFDLVYRLKTLDDANRVVSDEGADGRHGERWTFMRAAAARTPANGGVTAARCPACGAELRLNLDGACAHCRASVTNGTVDWIVADVAPAPFAGYSSDSQLAVAAPSVAQGVAALTAADPGFSLDSFKARAGTAFLALEQAWSTQNLDAGRAFLSPGAYFSWSAQLEALAAEGRRNVVENLVLHGIEVIRVVHGRVFDDLTVRIAASAVDFDVDRDGRLVFGDRAAHPFREEWTFQRSVGAATTGKPGTLESTCPGCGAPVALTQIGECRYCKAAVTSGKFDWVVSRIEQEDAASEPVSVTGDARADLVLKAGANIVGGLLGSLLSDD